MTAPVRRREAPTVFEPTNPKPVVDISPTLAPKSDQLNADDLIAGPLDITITGIEPGTREQPVVIHYDGSDGRPYKPSKSMRRVMAHCWGKDGKSYVGKHLRLYRDASIRYGGVEVGGIRISHLSHIDVPKPLALTVTRGKRVPYEVQPMFLAPRQEAQADTGSAEPSPEALDAMRAEGAAKAAEGMEALRLFWMTRTTAEKQILKTELEKDWKPAAAKATALKTARLEEFAL